MKQKDVLGIVPAQHEGKSIETEAILDLEDENEAKLYFEVAKARLLSVNNWHFISGIISGKFQLTNSVGEDLERNVQAGDYIKIDIPGPGSAEGGGYDWVFVEDLGEIKEADLQSVGFRVRPSHNPVSGKKEIAHFYKEGATSNFIVTRENNTVTAVILDRNLVPNDEPASVIDKVRHVAVGVGAIGIFSKLQWQNLVDGLVKKV